MANLLKNIPYKLGPSKVYVSYNKSVKVEYILELKSISGMYFVDSIKEQKKETNKKIQKLQNILQSRKKISPSELERLQASNLPFRIIMGCSNFG